MVTLETECSTKGHPTVFAAVPSRTTLTLFHSTLDSSDTNSALTLWQECMGDNEKHSSLSAGQFLMVCLMVSLLLYDILKLYFL
jgi:hypothetical protein